MIIVLSGEGPTDLGRCENGTGICTSPEFLVGPMVVLIDELVDEIYKYRPLRDTREVYRFYSKQILVERAKRKKSGRSIALPGKKHDVETGYFYINAWMLGEIALELENDENDKSVSVLFRDTDGTNSSPADISVVKRNSMIAGFERAQYGRGVPMVPVPKSEAWLLCAAQDEPYQNCGIFENLPGNDDAPRSAKRLLDEALDGKTSAKDLCEWLEDCQFDHISVSHQMPSYREFRSRMLRVLEDCR